MKTLIMQTKNKIKIVKYIILIFLILTSVLLFTNPKTYINSIYEGLCVWATAVLPALLPFFIITRSFTALNIIPYNNKFFNILGKIFKVPACGIYIFIMSVISGYPVGAKLIAEFFEQGCITQKQATKLVCLCMTSGPLFIVGTVGCMFLGSVKLGFILLLSHILGAIFNGLLYRNKITKDITFKNFNNSQINSNNILYEIMINSILSVMVVGSYIAIFYMLINMLFTSNTITPIKFILDKLLNFFNINGAADSVLIGLTEVTQGCKMISLINLSEIKKVVISSLLIGFGGICVHLQSLTFLISSKVNIKFYFISKISQSILSSIISFVLMLVFVV